MAWFGSRRSKRAGQSVLRRSVGCSGYGSARWRWDTGALGHCGLGRLVGWLVAQAGLVRQGLESEGLQLQASAAATAKECGVGGLSLSLRLRLGLRWRVSRIRNGSESLFKEKKRGLGILGQWEEKARAMKRRQSALQRYRRGVVGVGVRVMVRRESGRVPRLERLSGCSARVGYG